MNALANFTDHFLIAMPSLADANFSRTVTYICQHSSEGAMGIIINRATDLRLADVFLHMEIEPTASEAAEQPVYMGGPVQPERGFVLHSPPSTWDASLKVNDQIGITTSRDVLCAIAAGRGPAQALVALGYSGWGAGQLEREIAENAWLFGPANLEIIYEMPIEQRWKSAAKLIGINLDLISSEAGHA
jgi:putative transcriptional regulator